MTKLIKSMKGYKATDKDMECRGHQFILGEWAEYDGELKECESGFHFCEYPSGVWAYYSEEGTRVFEVEAEDILEVPESPGADKKRVARRVRLTREITPGGDSNTGDWNTGDSNTGHRNTGDSNTGHSNTGHRNTGDWNTGHRNTGDWNTGHRNTGDWNTGHRNTGDWNTGDSNTGHRNTGDSNTGHRNTGDSNTGHRNTGDWNACNRSAGLFCVDTPPLVVFDVQVAMDMDEFLREYPHCYELGALLLQDGEIEFEKFQNIPGITPEKLRFLHEKHKAGRRIDNSN
jgi:hypothetical protein